ncbi:MAG: hypothetical protein KZQ97_17010 [Candidatus Thiodiazotropha sp. (ex Dulcina madagascariensis)]|nr:hypothetical protein [Candidatus Thiodiazotropha sp. (ex Dulcina madagascariensis)]
MAYAKYIEGLGEMLTETMIKSLEHDIDAMRGFDSVETMQGYANQKYFSCKLRHQTIYRNLSPEKLQEELQKLLMKQKSKD